MEVQLVIKEQQILWCPVAFIDSIKNILCCIFIVVIIVHSIYNFFAVYLTQVLPYLEEYSIWLVLFFFKSSLISSLNILSLMCISLLSLIIILVSVIYCIIIRVYSPLMEMMHLHRPSLLFQGLKDKLHVLHLLHS